MTGLDALEGAIADLRDTWDAHLETTKARIRDLEERIASWHGDPTKRIAELEEEVKRVESRLTQVKLRLGLIARVSGRHEQQHENACLPVDDCLRCWPLDVITELREYAEREEP